MVELHYVIVQSTGSSPVVLDDHRFSLIGRIGRIAWAILPILPINEINASLQWKSMK